MRWPKEKREAEANRLLSSERAALCETSLSSGRLAQNGRASSTDDNGLGVREDGGDGEAAGALDIHEEGSGSRYKGLAGQQVSIDPSSYVYCRTCGVVVDGGGVP